MSAVLARDHDRYEFDDQGLTAMQAAYVRNVVRDCPSDRPEAARRAGYSETRIYVAVHELQNNLKVQAAIRREQERLHSDSAPVAFKTLLELLAPERNDSVRFQAAKDILDRCGYRPVEKLVVEHTLSPAERQARILELQQILGAAVQIAQQHNQQVIEAERVDTCT